MPDPKPSPHPYNWPDNPAYEAYKLEELARKLDGFDDETAAVARRMAKAERKRMQ